jgi:hypothetical protein
MAFDTAAGGIGKAYGIAKKHTEAIRPACDDVTAIVDASLEAASQVIP